MIGIYLIKNCQRGVMMRGREKRRRRNLRSSAVLGKNVMINMMDMIMDIVTIIRMMYKRKKKGRQMNIHNTNEYIEMNVIKYQQNNDRI
jgi:hypothetical protein